MLNQIGRARAHQCVYMYTHSVYPAVEFTEPDNKAQRKTLSLYTHKRSTGEWALILFRWWRWCRYNTRVHVYIFIPPSGTKALIVNPPKNVWSGARVGTVHNIYGVHVYIRYIRSSSTHSRWSVGIYMYMCACARGSRDRTMADRLCRSAVRYGDRSPPSGRQMLWREEPAESSPPRVGCLERTAVNYRSYYYYYIIIITYRARVRRVDFFFFIAAVLSSNRTLVFVLSCGLTTVRVRHPSSLC